MKNKIIALTLTAVLALSSTTAFASETANTTKVKFDLSNFKNYISDCTKENNQYKITLNGKTINLNSLNWKSIVNTKSAKPVAEKPVETQKPVETEKPAPVQPSPAPAKPAPAQPAPAPAQPAPAPAQPAPAPAKPAPAQPAPAQPAPAPAEPAAPATENNNSTASSNVSYEQKVVELVNVERQKNGLQPLTLDSAIANVARTKSKDMAVNNYFAHQSPTYGSAGDMLTRFGIKWTAWGENIAAGQRTPEEVVTAWMNSSGHRANILNSNFTKIGVGYVTNGSGRAYWTQIFAR